MPIDSRFVRYRPLELPAPRHDNRANDMTTEQAPYPIGTPPGTSPEGFEPQGGMGEGNRKR